jgi:hypothetical protein
MSLLNFSIIAVLALCLSAVCLVLIFVASVKHKAQITLLGSQYQAQELILSNMQLINEQINIDIEKLNKKNAQGSTESIQVSKHLEHRIKMLQADINNQQEVISQLQTDQGDDKFYSRAIKLAKKGASVDEIMTECELPYAEVEMLISVYQTKNLS